jgi:hypothetical protein
MPVLDIESRIAAGASRPVCTAACQTSAVLDAAAPRGKFVLDDSDSSVLLISAGVWVTIGVRLLTSTQDPNTVIGDPRVFQIWTSSEGNRRSSRDYRHECDKRAVSGRRDQ